MPNLQKALVFPSPSAQYEIQTIPIPELAPGQVLVRILASALNPADWKVPEMNIFPPHAYPMIMGFGAAGIVEDVAGDVTKYKKGDHIIAEGWLEEAKLVVHGTFQQYLNVPVDVTAKVPENMPFEEAATIFSGAATVAMGLYSQKPGTSTLGLTPPWEDDGQGKYAGQSIFIAGGATQTGQFACQFAKLSGFNPIITTTSAHSVDLAKHNGATHVIDRTLSQEKVVEEVLKIAGSPVDLAYDGVSEAETIELSVAVLRKGGSLIVLQPGKNELVNSLTAPKGVKWTFVVALGSLERNQGALAGLWERLPELLEDGSLQPTKAEVLPGGLRGVQGGLERLRKSQVSGVRLVVRPHDTT